MSEYCTIGNLRDEGLPVGDAQAPKVTELIREMSLFIERVTGWYFELREGQTLQLNGKGTRRLHLPIPILKVTELRRVWRSSVPPDTFVIDTTAYVVYGRQFPTDDRFNPKLELLGPTGDILADGGRTSFVKGVLNYEVDGDFGFVDEDPDNAGSFITPPAIRRACTIMVIANAGQLGDPDDYLAKKNIDIRGLTVQGRSYTWSGPVSSNTSSGIPEVDRTLAMYRRPPYAEAA